MNTDPVNPDFQRGYDRAAYGVTKDELENMGERVVLDALNLKREFKSNHRVEEPPRSR